MGSSTARWTRCSRRKPTSASTCTAPATGSGATCTTAGATPRTAGGVLADWGAEVVKIEPPDGDPFRGLYLAVSGAELPANPPFELDNRGKRSIALDLRTEDGRRIAAELIDRADVFVTNVRPEI